MSGKLADKKCVPCEGGTPPMKGEEIQKNKSQLKNDWKVVDETKIRHEFKFKDFKQAMAFVNKAADVAEEEGHHPDIHIHYNRVVIELWTHSIGGLSENDFIMAAKIERLV
jgi:4a-hydroxytetrahydrobiopterin dehydratase